MPEDHDGLAWLAQARNILAQTSLPTGGAGARASGIVGACAPAWGVLCGIHFGVCPGVGGMAGRKWAGGCAGMRAWSLANKVLHPETWKHARAISERLGKVCGHVALRQLNCDRRFIRKQICDVMVELVVALSPARHCFGEAQKLLHMDPLD